MQGLPPDDTPIGENDPVGLLGPQDWIDWPETRAVVAALAARGSEIRFVGGCVRDALAHRPINDVDIATPDHPDQVMELLATAGIKSIPTGLAHGTVTAVIGARTFEITTLRRDVETFGRRAKVAFTDDWTVDAARRDFTINAMSCRPDGLVFDPFEGMSDLAAGRIRFVGKAGERMDEDLLRMLRYFRFFAYFGHPPVDEIVLAAVRVRAHRILELSGERLRAEMIKLLAAPEPTSTLIWMDTAGLLQRLLPEARDFGRLRVLCFLETRGLIRPGITTDPLRRLAAVLRVDAGQAEMVADRFRLSNTERHRLLGLITADETPDPAQGDAWQRRLLHHLGTERYRDLTLLGWAERKAYGDRMPARQTARWISLLDQADAWQPKTLPIGGQDLVALGIPPGPGLGALLARLEQWWEDSDFTADRQALLDRAKTLAGAR